MVVVGRICIRNDEVGIGGHTVLSDLGQHLQTRLLFLHNINDILAKTDSLNLFLKLSTLNPS